MDTATLRQAILDFFENVEKYYGSKTELTQGLVSDPDQLDAHQTAWNLSEFELIRSAYRNSGDKFMFEGRGTYYEISAERIIDFRKTGRNKVEFVEQYSESVFRITKIRFHYKY